MYIFNISLVTEKAAGQQVLEELLTYTRSFDTKNSEVKIQLLEVPESQHEGYTYCLQLLADTESQIDRFFDEEVSVLLELLSTKYPNQVLNFSTLMRVLS